MPNNEYRITNNDNIRVRFAPSPTGFLHVGGARTALFNWFFARHFNGKFILRIEDTDRARSTEDYLNSILDDLKWLGLDYDEGPKKEGSFGPYFQTERISLYQKYAKALIDKNLAYYCYCTQKELETQREELSRQKKQPLYGGRCRDLSDSEVQNFIKEGRKPTIRFSATGGSASGGKTKPAEIKFNDLVRGVVSFDSGLMDDFIIMKSDGFPVYNFAAVVDDYLMQITHVIRGEEHISNTPRQIMLIEVLGFTRPQWAHLPIILNTDRSKLSKRQGGLDIADFRAKGFLPQALVNFLALLGWSPGQDREILDLDTIIKEFDLSRVIKHPAVFDSRKLEWMNSQYVKNLSPEELLEKVEIYIQKRFPCYNIKGQEKYIKSILMLFKDRIKILEQFPEEVSYFFENVEKYDEKGIKKYFSLENTKGYLTAFKEELEKLSLFNKDTIENTLRSLADRLSIKPSDLIHPVRLALTRRTISPGLFEVMEILGKEKTLRRLGEFIKILS